MAKKHTRPDSREKSDAESGKLMKVDHEFPDGTKSAFSNHMIVQARGDGIFHLSFFEIAHPILLGDDESVLQQVDETDSVRAPCVARLVVSAEQMKRMVAAMAEGYENYEEGLKDDGQQPDISGRRKNAS